MCTCAMGYARVEHLASICYKINPQNTDESQTITLNKTLVNSYPRIVAITDNIDRGVHKYQAGIFYPF